MILLLRLLFGSKTLTVSNVSVNNQLKVEKMNKQGNMFTISSFRLNLRKFSLRTNSFNLRTNSFNLSSNSNKQG